MESKGIDLCEVCTDREIKGWHAEREYMKMTQGMTYIHRVESTPQLVINTNDAILVNYYGNCEICGKKLDLIRLFKLNDRYYLNCGTKLMEVNHIRRSIPFGKRLRTPYYNCKLITIPEIGNAILFNIPRSGKPTFKALIYFDNLTIVKEINDGMLFTLDNGSTISVFIDLFNNIDIPIIINTLGDIVSYNIIHDKGDLVFMSKIFKIIVTKKDNVTIKAKYICINGSHTKPAIRDD